MRRDEQQQLWSLTIIMAGAAEEEEEQSTPVCCVWTRVLVCRVMMMQSDRPYDDTNCRTEKGFEKERKMACGAAPPSLIIMLAA